MISGVFHCKDNFPALLQRPKLILTDWKTAGFVGVGPHLVGVTQRRVRFKWQVRG